MMDEVTITHEEKYPLIKCPFCRAMYVYIRVFRNEVEYRYAREIADTYFKQVSTDYCPNCGRVLKDVKNHE